MAAPAVLLDTHALYWLATSPREMSEKALALLDPERAETHLLLSPISAWEMGVATQKRRVSDRPDLGGRTPGTWFHDTARQLGAEVVLVDTRIAEAAAEASVIYGRKDPGDCFLIATAHVRGIPIVTRDGAMRALARRRPDYLTVIPC